jgi:membrane protein implicated in regulation of membrane protease activity
MDPLWRTHLIVSAVDWLLLALLGWAAVRWFAVAWWIPALVIAAWMLKDVLVFPVSRWYYEAQPSEHRIIGEEGHALGDIESHGFVHVRGEVWRARLRPGAPHVRKGGWVRVCAAEGLHLMVEPVRPGGAWIGEGSHARGSRVR